MFSKPQRKNYSKIPREKFFSKEGRQQTPLLPEICNDFRTMLKCCLQDLTFHRVTKVVAADRDLILAVYYKPDANGKVAIHEIDPNDYHPNRFTEEEHEHNITERYRKYFFFASDKPLRGKSKGGLSREVFCASNKASQIDILGTFQKDKRPTFLFSNDRRMRNASVPPKVGDLVCLIADKPSRGRKNPEARYWMTCSEQFMRMWTLIMHDEHPTFKKEGDALRRHCMSGNRLMTNSYKKWLMSHQQNRIPIGREEAQTRFYASSVEFVAKNWVHVYAALVLMARYGEIPCSTNVPQNLDDGPNMNQWNLPKNFVETMLKDFIDPFETHKMTWPYINSVVVPGKISRVRKISRSRPEKQTPPTSEDFPSLRKAKEENLPSLPGSRSWASIASQPKAEPAPEEEEDVPRHPVYVFEATIPDGVRWGDVPNDGWVDFNKVSHDLYKKVENIKV